MQPQGRRLISPVPVWDDRGQADRVGLALAKEFAAPSLTFAPSPVSQWQWTWFPAWCKHCKEGPSMEVLERSAHMVWDDAQGGRRAQSTALCPGWFLYPGGGDRSRARVRRGEERAVVFPY